MLKITRGSAADADCTHQTVLFRLEGRIAGPWVEELRRVCQEAISRNDANHLVLDVAGVSFIEADGVVACRELQARGVSLTNQSRFVAEQLKGETHAAD